MAIPDFQSIMLPLLRFCNDGKEHTNREAIDSLAKELGLTEDEHKQLLPSGQQCVFDNQSNPEPRFPQFLQADAQLMDEIRAAFRRASFFVVRSRGRS